MALKYVGFWTYKHGVTDIYKQRQITGIFSPLKTLFFAETKIAIKINLLIPIMEKASAMTKSRLLFSGLFFPPKKKLQK